MATAKVDEMTKLLQTVQDQMQRRVREDKQTCRIKNILQREPGQPPEQDLKGDTLYGTSAIADDCVS